MRNVCQALIDQSIRHFGINCKSVRHYVIRHYGLDILGIIPCNHANRVSGVNKYTFHVGHPGGLNDTIKLTLDVPVKMVNIYAYFVSCVHCSAPR